MHKQKPYSLFLYSKHFKNAYLVVHEPTSTTVAYSTANTQPGHGCYSRTVQTKHLLLPLAHSDSCQLVRHTQDQTQSTCVFEGCDPPQRKGSVSVSILKYKNRKGTSHNFLWWHTHTCFKYWNGSKWQTSHVVWKLYHSQIQTKQLSVFISVQWQNTFAFYTLLWYDGYFLPSLTQEWPKHPYYRNTRDCTIYWANNRCHLWSAVYTAH